MAIFGKGNQQRINDTLAMIQNAPELTMMIRQQIVTMVNNAFPRLTAENRDVYNQLSGDMSVKHHIGAGVAPGNAAQREMRRAIYLLWITIGRVQGIDMFIAPLARQHALVTPTAGLNAVFADAMRKASVVAAGIGGQFVLQELEAHPVRFLTQHKIFIAGLPDGRERFSTAPTGNYQNVLNFHFQYDAGQDRFVLGGGITPQYGADHAFATVSVPAVHWSNVPNVNLVPGPGHSFAGVRGCELVGANFMVTTQFTGCAFSWASHGGVLRASHISPAGGGVGVFPGGGNGVALAEMASGTMVNANNTPLTVFGAGAGNAPVPGGGNPFYPDPQVTPISWVSIIGVDKGGNGWRLYTQVIDGHGQITEARRIM